MSTKKRNIRKSTRCTKINDTLHDKKEKEILIKDDHV